MGFDKDTLKQNFTTDFNSLCENNLRNDLSAAGFSSSDIDDIFSNNTITQISSSDLTNADNSLDFSESSLQTVINNNEIQKYNVQKDQESKKAQVSDVQSAKEVVVTWPEPKFSGAVFTSPIDQQDANYTVNEDYPETYGFIDKVKNWFKINQKKKYAEFVHSSGSALKIDQFGNVTIHIKGNLKFIIEGDLSESIHGNEDHIVDKNSHTFVSFMKDTLSGTETRVAIGKMILRGLPILEN